MKTIPTMLEPSISLDLRHLRECDVRDCTICSELRRRDEGPSILRGAWRAWKIKQALGVADG